jgi:uracil-DNA glycosylase family 4
MTHAWEGFLPENALIMARRREQSLPESTALPALLAEGSMSARVAFVAQSTSSDDALDPLGRPFAGPAGQLLDKMIEAMGLSPDRVYLCNLADPSSDGAPLLERLGSLKPSHGVHERPAEPLMVVALGERVARALLGANLAANEEFATFRGRLFALSNLRVLSTWHPQELLQNPAAKKQAWQDLKQVARELGLVIPGPGR